MRRERITIMPEHTTPSAVHHTDDDTSDPVDDRGVHPGVCLLGASLTGLMSKLPLVPAVSRAVCLGLVYATTQRVSCRRHVASSRKDTRHNPTSTALATTGISTGMLLAMGSILVLSGCGVGQGGRPGAAAPTATPNATTILMRVQQAKFQDAAFTLSYSGSFSGANSTGSGIGKITTNPRRADVILNLTVSGQQLTIESITDAATNTEYAKISGLDLPGIDSSKWIKTALGSGSSTALVDTSQIAGYGKNLSNVRLVGTEVVGGVKVWHLTGTSTQDGLSGTVSMYVTQDGHYYPKKEVVTTTGASAATFTLDFTSFNTGITISLPTASEVQSLPNS